MRIEKLRYEKAEDVSGSVSCNVYYARKYVYIQLAYSVANKVSDRIAKLTISDFNELRKRITIDGIWDKVVNRGDLGKSLSYQELIYLN
jgi:hypothetical protein